MPAQHAPQSVSRALLGVIEPGDFLCSEPSFPCWNNGTHYEQYPNTSRFRIVCVQCGGDASKPLPFHKEI